MFFFFEVPWLLILALLLALVVLGGLLFRAFLNILYMIVITAFILIGFYYLFRSFSYIKSNLNTFVGYIFLSVICIGQLLFNNYNVVIATECNEKLQILHPGISIILTTVIICLYSILVNIFSRLKKKKYLIITIPLLACTFIATFFLPYKIAERCYYNDTVDNLDKNIVYEIEENSDVYMHMSYINSDGAAESSWYILDEKRIPIASFKKNTVVYGTGKSTSYDGEEYIEVFNNGKIGYVDKNSLKKMP